MCQIDWLVCINAIDQNIAELAICLPLLYIYMLQLTILDLLWNFIPTLFKLATTTSR